VEIGRSHPQKLSFVFFLRSDLRNLRRSSPRKCVYIRETRQLLLYELGRNPPHIVSGNLAAKVASQTKKVFQSMTGNICRPRLLEWRFP
jgi:hypothetical protein